MKREIQVTIRVGSRMVAALLALAAFLAAPPELGSESLTVATTYPSPAGVYATLSATQKITLKNGGNTVWKCTAAGAVLPAGSLTTDSTQCGAAPSDTGLRVP